MRQLGGVLTIILGIDPGGTPPNGTTGISVWNINTNGKLRRIWNEAVEGGFDGFCEWLHSEKPEECDYVICEKFVNYNKAADVSPLLIEGVVRYVWPNVILQPASGKNTAVPDRILKENGWYDDNSHHHDVREAGRHVLYWLKKQNHPAVLRLFK